jgi:hypothetical protein
MKQEQSAARLMRRRPDSVWLERYNLPAGRPLAIPPSYQLQRKEFRRGSMDYIIDNMAILMAMNDGAVLTSVDLNRYFLMEKGDVAKFIDNKGRPRMQVRGIDGRYGFSKMDFLEYACERKPNAVQSALRRFSEAFTWALPYIN